MICPYKAGHKGFTLLEVLVALAITASMVVMLFSSYFVIENAISSTDSTVLRLHEARTALDTMRMELEAALILKNDSGLDSDEQFRIRSLHVYGKPASEVEFFTHSSVMPGPARLTYRVEEIHGQNVLIKTVRRAHQEDFSKQEAEVMEGLEGFEIEAEESEGEWVKTWREGSVPKRLRISMTISVSGRDIILSTLVKPRLGSRL